MLNGNTQSKKELEPKQTGDFPSASQINEYNKELKQEEAKDIKYPVDDSYDEDEFYDQIKNQINKESFHNRTSDIVATKPQNKLEKNMAES